MGDDVQKAIERRVQVRKAPQHELKNLRPHGIALVPRGANAKFCVMMKADDPHGDEMTTKLRLSPTAKSAITNAMHTHLTALNSTFALVTGADDDEAAEVPVEVVEMLKSAGDGLHALAKQYGKPPMMADDEKKRREKEEVDKAGRTFAKKNEETIRAAIAQHKETAAKLEAMLTTPESQDATGGSSAVAKADGVDATAVGKLIDEKLAPVLKSLDAFVEKMAPKPAPEARVIQPSNGASTERPAPDVRPAYNPRDLDSVFQKS